MTSEEQELIFNYLNNSLSSSEIEEVEQRMESDPIFREHLLIEKQLFNTLDPNEWSFAENVSSRKKDNYKQLYKSKETTLFKDTIKRVNSEYQNDQQKSTKKIFKRWYSVAAAILVICSLTFLLPKKSSLQELYAESINLSELPSMVVRNSNISTHLNLAQEAFETKEYQKAIELINKEEQATQKINGISLLYKGIAHMELENYDKALEILNSISSSKLIISQEGYWYKALLFLKKGEKEMAKKVLKEITSIPNHYKYKEAKEILKEL